MKIRIAYSWSTPFLAALAMSCGSVMPGSQAPLSAPTSSGPIPEQEPVDTQAAASAREQQGSAAPEVPPSPTGLYFELSAKSASKLKGWAKLTETNAGVRIQIEVENVNPGDHGAHVHEKGDCSALDASSAGDHFNPTQHQHGLPSMNERHLGDMGNLNVGQDGKGSMDVVLDRTTLQPSAPNSLLNRSIIIHSKRDDGGAPAGNAGGRIGCGEIRVSLTE